MDVDACNYSVHASESDNSCTYPELYYDCSGNYLYIEEFLNQDHSNSLEIVTWNIEWFPKNGNNTIDTLATIIDYLDLDIIAIQEMTDSNSLNSLKNHLGNNWEAFHTIIDSEYGVLAYLINNQNITINREPYEILPESQYDHDFAFKHPYVLEIIYNDIEYILINIHFKCCDGSEDRRLRASEYLEEYIDDYFDNQNVIVLGDFNDLIYDDSPNVFAPFTNKPDNYKFVDMDIASGIEFYWSFPSWPSHLDHILITDELFDENYNVHTLHVDRQFFSENSDYDEYVSDHRPVLIQFYINP